MIGSKYVIGGNLVVHLPRCIYAPFDVDAWRPGDDHRRLCRHCLPLLKVDDL